MSLLFQRGAKLFEVRTGPVENSVGPSRSTRLIEVSPKDGLKRSYLFILSSPVLSHHINSHIDLGHTKIFPPVSLRPELCGANVYEKFAAVFPDFAQLPDPIDYDPSLYPSIEGALPCYGLRLDSQDSNVMQTVRALLAAIRGITRQWWITGLNPFITDVRYTAFQAEDGCIGYNPTVIAPRQMGFELPLQQCMWDTIGNYIYGPQQVKYADSLMLSAVSQYQSFDDGACVVSIATHFEVCERSIREAKGVRKHRNLEDLRRESTLLDNNAKDIYKKIIIDRNNIAHGFPMKFMKELTDIPQAYIAAALEFHNRFRIEFARINAAG